MPHYLCSHKCHYFQNVPERVTDIDQGKKGILIVAVYKIIIMHFSAEILLLNGIDFHSMLMVVMVVQ